MRFSPNSTDLLFAHGFSYRKQAILRKFIAPCTVKFVRSGMSVPRGGALLLWGSAVVPAGVPADARIVRVEDGFLRSVGLGAALARPLSWVFDSSGLYYDATRASDLEKVLQTESFSPQLLERARLLRERVVAAGITKYSVGAHSWAPPSNRKVVLVPGQVETDASLKFGAPAIRTNMGLLQAVRAAEPGCYLVYKPHPDVRAGLRAGGLGEDHAAMFCDEIIADVAMGELLKQVDAVHVLTSLTGFEALLRHKPVTCYGQPFYAGWGLTNDMSPLARRSRTLSLDQLVAGALLLYPTYVSHLTSGGSTPEGVLDELIAWRNKKSTAGVFCRQVWQGLLAHTVAQS
jgi:capsular polysaccharide export protein